MMKSKFLFRIFVSVVLVLVTSLSIAKEGERPIIISDVGFATPESVEYYAKQDVYLVTNINGDGLTKDSNGFISKLSPEGKVIDLKWLDGAKQGITLHAPKGAEIVGNNLFVTDIDQIQIFHLPDGKQTHSITIKGASFLNGITIGEEDSVYVTDSGFGKGLKPTGTDAIYQVWPDGKYQLVYKNPDMGGPNGIWNDRDRLLVVTFGSGKMLAIDRSGKQHKLPTPPGGQIDGIVKLDDGRFLLSSWEKSAIFSYHNDQSFKIIADDLDAPADLGVDTKRKRLLVPLFKQHKVTIVPF